MTAPLGRLPGEVRRHTRQPQSRAIPPTAATPPMHCQSCRCAWQVVAPNRRAKWHVAACVAWSDPGTSRGCGWDAAVHLLHTRLLHQIDLMYPADRGVNESSCPGVRVLGCPSAAMAAADRTRGQRLPGPGIGDAGGRAAQPGLLSGGARPASACCSCAPATAPAHRSARPCYATAPAARSRWPVPAAGPSPGFIPTPYGCCATSSASTSPASPPALGHGDRPAVRLRDQLVRQGPRGLPRLSGPSPAGALEHPRPRRSRRHRPVRLPRLPAHRGRHRHPHQVPAPVLTATRPRKEIQP